MREERRLKVSENRVLRRTFGPERDEVTVEWRKLHNEELNDLYSSPNIDRVIKSKRMRWAEHVDERIILTLRLLMSCIYGAPSKVRNANVVYIWTYVWQR